MAELVDALDSKSCSRKGVQVRFLFWARITADLYGRLFLYPNIIPTVRLRSVSPSSKAVPSQALCSSEGCLAPLLKLLFIALSITPSSKDVPS